MRDAHESLEFRRVRFRSARPSEGLAARLPEAGMVGEEACESDAGLIGRVGQGLNWIIDPSDGTSNFAAGESPFGILVALAENGNILAGWIYDLVRGRMCQARKSVV